MRKSDRKAYNERNRRHEKRYASEDNVGVSERQGVVHLSRKEWKDESHKVSYRGNEKSFKMRTTALTA